MKRWELSRPKHTTDGPEDLTIADEVADEFPTALATLADDSGEVAVDELCTVARPITRRGPAPKTPRIHYLETSSNWPNLRWLLLTMRFDIVHSSRYLNSIDVGRSIPRAASILKRLPIL